MRQISTILEIGTSKVVSIIGESGPYGVAHILGSASVPYAGLKKHKWVEKHALAPAVLQALREAEKRAGHRVKRVQVGVPADFIKVICCEMELSFHTYHDLTQDDLDKLFRESRKRLNIPKEYKMLHRCPIEYVLDDARHTMEPVGRKAHKLKAVISYVLAEKWFMDGIHKILTGNGYTTSTFIASTYASAIRFIAQDKRDRDAVLIDIGQYSTALAVVKGDGLVFHKVLPFGGGNITADLQRVLNVPEHVAEELKKRSLYGLSLSEDDFYEICDQKTYRLQRFEAIKVQEVIEERMKEMFSFIVAVLDKNDFHYPHYVPFYVTGGTAEMRGMHEFVQKQTGHNTTVIQPQSTCFNHGAYTSSLAVLDLALEAVSDETPGFFGTLKNIFTK